MREEPEIRRGCVLRDRELFFFKSGLPWPRRHPIVVGSMSKKASSRNEPPELPLFDDERRAGLKKRLARAEGQVRGIARMIDDQRPCAEVLQQLASVQSALRGVSRQVLRNYLERCATDAIRSGDDSVYDELMDAIFRFAK